MGYNVLNSLSASIKSSSARELVSTMSAFTCSRTVENVGRIRLTSDISKFVLTHPHEIEVLCLACIFKDIHDLFGGVVICAANATAATRLTHRNA